MDQRGHWLLAGAAHGSPPFLGRSIGHTLASATPVGSEDTISAPTGRCGTLRTRKKQRLPHKVESGNLISDILWLRARWAFEVQIRESAYSSSLPGQIPLKYQDVRGTAPDAECLVGSPCGLARVRCGQGRREIRHPLSSRHRVRACRDTFPLAFNG